MSSVEANLDKFLKNFAQKTNQNSEQGDEDQKSIMLNARKRRRSSSGEEEDEKEDKEIKEIFQNQEKDEDEDKDQSSLDPVFDSQLEDLANNLEKNCDIMGSKLTIEQRNEKMKEVRRQLF